MPSKAKLTKEQEHSFKMWMEDGNVIQNPNGTYSTQDALYRNELKDIDSLKEYFYNEFIKGQSDSYAGGGNVKSIEKKVQEVNRLIELGNKNGISVVDSRSTWEAPMKYKPIRYSNGVLYVEYQELDLYTYNRTGVSKWVTKKDKILKRNMQFDSPLNDIARMYRKALKQEGIEFAEGGEAGFDDAGTSMVLYHEKKGNWMVAKGQVYLWLYDVEDSVEKIENEEFDYVIYPYASQGMAWQKGFIPPLKRIWTKKFQKEHKGSEHLLGVIKAYLIDNDTKLYIDMMSVNPTKKKKGIMSYMLKELRDTFNIPKENVEFSQLTEEGKKFVDRGKYASGGDINYEALETIKKIDALSDSEVNEKYKQLTYLDIMSPNREGDIYEQNISTEEKREMLKRHLFYNEGGDVKKKIDFYYDKYENGGFVGGDVIKFKYNGQEYTRKVESVDENGNALVNLFKTEKAIINPADIKEIKKEFDDKSVIVNKIGLSEENADYLISLSPTFAVWLADSIVNAVIPILNISNVTTREEAIKFINEQPRVITNLRERIRGILDWLQHPTTRKQNLRELSFAEAERKSKEWHSEIQVQGGDINFTEPSENIILTEYPENDNGVKYYWVWIRQSYCDVESRRMGHCGRTSASSLISLRSIRPYTETDTITDSHVTIAYDENDGYIYQAKGKKNQKPAEKYFPYIFDLVKILTEGSLKSVLDEIKIKRKESIEKEIKGLEFWFGIIDKITDNPKIDRIMSDMHLLQESYDTNKVIEDDLVNEGLFNATEDERPKIIQEILDVRKLNTELDMKLKTLKEEYRNELGKVLDVDKEKQEEYKKYLITPADIDNFTNEPLYLIPTYRRYNNALTEFNKELKYNEDEDVEFASFKGFSSEYKSSEDYGWEDMTNEQIKELYDINPEVFNDFASRYMLYEAGIIAERPSTIFVISKDAEYVEDLLNVDSNLRDGLVKDVLAGDSYDLIDTSYSWDYYYDEASNYVDELKPNQYEEVIDKIVEITGYEKEVVKENGAKYYLDGDDDEFDKDEFDYIRRAIARAMADAEADAYSKYYYELIESALQELGGVKELNDSGVEIEIDLLDKLELNQISSYMKDLDSESLEDVFWEAQRNDDIELPRLSIDDRYSAYADDWQDYFDIDNY